MKARITELFAIERSSVQGGMHYVGFAELAAAVSNAGDLGKLASTTQVVGLDDVLGIAGRMLEGKVRDRTVVDLKRR